ncbi:MAG: triose-phosphate isomerase, partial [Armatimonadetes bacterium]|nr:triose-phosphate isomerase [Armatimonadota bacterium]
DMSAAQLAYFSENDDTVNAKLHAALSAGLTPIVCVGETIDERKAGKTDEIIRVQVEKGLANITNDQASKMVIAYEPVWAIGTGEVCDASEANRVCGMIRSVVASMFDSTTAEKLRVQYGGSVKPDNAKELLAQPEIDGALVGGASLKVADFLAIIKAAR